MFKSSIERGEANFEYYTILLQLLLQRSCFQEELQIIKYKYLKKYSRWRVAKMKQSGNRSG